MLPFTNFWVSTRPFGTPIGPYFVVWFLTILMILAVPTGDAFNFGEPLIRTLETTHETNPKTVSDLGVFPTAAFNLSMAVGLYVVRWRRQRANLPEPEFKAYHVVVIFNILIQLYLLVMPWYPPWVACTPATLASGMPRTL